MDTFNSIILDDERSIFVISGDRESSNEIANLFKRIGSANISKEHLRGNPPYANKEEFLKLAYSKFLDTTITTNDFDKLEGSNLKEIVSGDYFHLGETVKDELFDAVPSSKKLIIFVGETVPNETIFDREKALVLGQNLCMFERSND